MEVGDHMYTDWEPAIVALAAAIPIVAAALATWLQGHATAKSVAEVHELVNGTQARTVDRVEQLAAALTTAGVPVPPHPPRKTP